MCLPQVIAFNLPLEEIQGLKAMFESMDNDKSGTITIEEMREGLKAKGWTDKDAELNRLMADADVNGDGTIDYQVTDHCCRAVACRHDHLVQCGGNALANQRALLRRCGLLGCVEHPEHSTARCQCLP